MEYCNSCTERWPSCPKCSAGQCSGASPKHTCSPGDPQVLNNPPPPGQEIPQAQNSRPGPVIIPAQIQAAPSMGILGTPLGMQHAPPENPQAQNNPSPPGPAILQAQNNGPGLVIIPPQMQAAAPMAILGTQLGMQHAPPVNLLAQNNPPAPSPAIPHAQNNPPGAANPQAQNNPPPSGLANLQGQKNSSPPGPAIPQAHNNPPGTANPQAQNNPPPPGPANLQDQNNPPLPRPANFRAQNVLNLVLK